LKTRTGSRQSLPCRQFDRLRHFAAVGALAAFDGTAPDQSTAERLRAALVEVLKPGEAQPQ
jgi:hypothetical protein